MAGGRLQQVKHALGYAIAFRDPPFESYRVLKGTLVTYHMNPSHFAVPTARLYGWLPLSDAYGIGCAKGGINFRK